MQLACAVAVGAIAAALPARRAARVRIVEGLRAIG
jgi:ABC-type antimicrobial peptide transport system permease subunit